MFLECSECISLCECQPLDPSGHILLMQSVWYEGFISGYHCPPERLTVCKVYDLLKTSPPAKLTLGEEIWDQISLLRFNACPLVLVEMLKLAYKH